MSEETAQESKECTCRVCKLIFVPSFAFDFYPDDEKDPDVGRCERCMMSEMFGGSQSKPDPVPVPGGEHLTKVCKLGQGEEVCRYLCFRGGMKCAKGSSLQAEIDQRSVAGTMAAKGDNCSGPTDFTPTATE